ncbi:Gfo/Idh/MocA family protein [Pseudaquabacterium rugosum]|uniref:Inositol 2-dehydrogenase n=1 Tax=Pseudaquabacterium rugosum TaxID=2984194 RepID=A0ABU9BIG1_9BURK
MTLRIGIIGCGGIGQEHARRLHVQLPGARVVALQDLRRDTALAFNEQAGLRARVHERMEDLIASPEVDAVLVASWGPAHEAQVLACIDAGKPVFCEKPLATTADGARRIVEAEVAAGRRLVQVGFMRRFDAGYRLLKQTVTSGAIGAPLLAHCAHRNPAVPDSYVGDMGITDTFIHEIDTLRWLLDDDYANVQVREGRKTRHAHAGLHDPLMVTLQTRGGVLIDTEIFVACRFGYDIQCQIVGETGAASLPEPMSVTLREGGRQGGAILMDWKRRFIEAYDVELAAWLADTAAGQVSGPTAWDGYLASATAEACIRARRSGAIEPLETMARPALYDPR